MKTRFLFTLLALASGAPLFAQYAVPVDMPPPSAPPALPPQNPDQVDQLVSPIALYPDPLVALILPAATTPSDIALADRIVRSNGDPAAVAAQPVDESVKALAHYPQLIAWMDDNLEWTQQLGAVFAQQPADVMNSVQRLRARARDAGILTSTPQEQVVVQDNAIEILPAQPDVIYVPTYDPEILYSNGGYRRSRAALTFGVAFSTGPWLDYGFDWRQRSVWIDRSQNWNRGERRAYSAQPVVSAERREWRPRADVSRRAVAAPGVTTRIEIARPTPMQSSRTWTNERDRNTTSRAEIAPPTRSYQPPLGPNVAPTGRTYEQPNVRIYSRESAPAPIVTPNDTRNEQWRRDRREGPYAAPQPTPQVYPSPQAYPAPQTYPAQVQTPSRYERSQRVYPQAQPAAPVRGRDEHVKTDKEKEDERRKHNGKDERNDEDDQRRRGDN